MSVSINDLKPKEIKIKVGELELTAKPLRVSHALIMAKVGDILEKPQESSSDEIDQAQKDLDKVIGQLIPELKGIELDMKNQMEILTELMAGIEPDDNKELREKGVKIDTDPKV